MPEKKYLFDQPIDKAVKSKGLKGLSYYQKKYNKTPAVVDNPPITNTTPNPRILKAVAQSVGRELVLATAQPGDPEPYVYGHSYVRPKVIAADDSGEYLVLDLLWSRGEIDSVAGIPEVGWSQALYMPDVGHVRADNASLHEHFTGTAGQSASTIMTALKGSYPSYPGRAHSVISMQDGWNLNLMGVIYGRKIYDYRTSPATFSWSQNPALILGDILTLCGYSVDESSLNAAADHCDELVGSLSPQHKRWEISCQIDDRQSLQYWTHALAQYANCFVDRVSGNSLILVPDKPRSSVHTITADDMIEGTVRVRHRGAKSVPEAVTVTTAFLGGQRWSVTYPDPLDSSPITVPDPGTVSQLDMPYWRRPWGAERKAEEVYRKAQSDLEVEFVTFDKGLTYTVGDVATITNAAYGLSSKQMVLTEAEALERGRWRTTWGREYDATHFVDADSGEPSVNTTTLYNPYRPPDGPTPTLTAELVTSTSPNYYRIKIDFSPTQWAYLKDYKINVYQDGVSPQPILHSEYVAKGSETGSPETITVYADLTDSPGFQMSIGDSPQTVYRVDVYNRSQWTTQDGAEVLSATPGTATVTDPGDPNILWTEDPITVYRFGPDAASNIYATLEFVYFIADYTYGGNPALPWLVYEPAFGTLPTAANQYLFKVDLISTEAGSNNLEINFTTGLEGSWLDFYTYHTAESGVFIDLGDTTANSTAEHKIIDVTIAQDNGAGSPVAGTAVTKRVNIISYKGSGEFLAFDNFTGTNGTNLTAHTPDTQTVSPGGWTALSGTFEIQSNEAESISGAADYSIDAGVTDFEVAAEVSFNGVSGGLLGRVQDSSNYWELNVTSPSTSDPVLNLVKVVAGSPTTVATKTLTGAGSLGATPIQMRLSFDGNVITGALNKYWTAMDGPSEVTYTDTAFNTETACGITAAGAGVEFNRLSISGLEATLLP